MYKGVSTTLHDVASNCSFVEKKMLRVMIKWLSVTFCYIHTEGQTDNCNLVYCDTKIILLKYFCTCEREWKVTGSH